MYPAAAPAAKYCLAEQELRSEGHASELCGAKTNNLLALRKLLPDSVSTPASAVIPFGTLAKTLADAANAAANAAYVTRFLEPVCLNLLTSLSFFSRVLRRWTADGSASGPRSAMFKRA